jgi:hypothetical protein
MMGFWQMANKVLHLTAIPLCSVATSELNRKHSPTYDILLIQFKNLSYYHA